MSAMARRLRRAALGSVVGAALVLSACKGGAPAEGPAATGSSTPQAAQGSTSAAASTPVTRPSPAEPSPVGGPQRLPAASRALPAAHTLGLVGLEGLDWAFRALNVARKHALEHLPPPIRAQVPELISDERKLVEFLDFPPETPSGWQTAGLNPGPGVVLAFDDRVSAVAPLPLVYVSVRDRGVLMNWLVGVDRRRGGAGHAQATGDTHGKCEIFEFADERGCIAPRRGYQVFMPLPSGLPAEKVTALESAFSAHIDDAGPVLSDDARFKAAFTDYPGRFMTFAWADTRKVAERITGSDALPAPLAFYVDRFPGAAILAGKDLAVVRLLADEAGRRALNQVFGTPHKPGALAARLPATGGAFFRFAVAPNTLFTGLTDLVPPGDAETKAQIAMVAGAVPAALGASLGELSKALSGQFALLATLPAQPVGGPPMPDPNAQLLAVGLVDAAAADALLDRVLAAGAAAGHLSHDTLKLAGGETARRFTLPQTPPVYLVRVDDQWLLGLSPTTLEAALKRPGLDAAKVPTLTGEGFFAMGVDMSALIGLMGSAAAGGAAGGSATDAKALKGLLGDAGFSQFEIGLDAHGVALRNGKGLALMGGIMAAIAIPAFVKYIRRAKTSEARMNVMRLAHGVRAQQAEGQAAPLAEAPLTPDLPCDEEGYEATAALFAHPTFKALGFAPEGKARYRYGVRTLADGQVEVRAEGDLDCDGVSSVFRVVVGAEGPGDLEVEKELE